MIMKNVVLNLVFFTIIGVLLFAGVYTVSAQKVFVHPGAISSKVELDFVKEKIKAGEQPWSTAYTQMLSIATASNVTTVPGDENGQRDFSKTIYANALAWWYSDNVMYANRAIAMLKVWATTFTGYVPPAPGNGNQAQLDAAWMGSLLGPAAELMRNYSAWTDADRTLVINMFKTKFYPALNQMSTWNGNNDLTQIEAMFSMAVFNEDETELNLAVSRLKARNPAYFYLSTDAPATRSIAGSTYPGNWYAPKLFVDGLTQETCRDNDHHAQYGSAAAFHAAEIAWHQGVDVWTENTARYTATMELLAKQLTSGTMQGTCTDNVTLSTTGGDPQDLSDILEIAYNHYHNRKGLALPETEKCLQLIRKNPKQGNTISPSNWNIFFETLTHADLVETPVPLCTKPNLGVDQSICGQTSIKLNSSITNTTNKTFTWYKDNVVIPNQITANLTITQAGTYSVNVDSLGCKTSDNVVVNGTLTVNLGADKELCNPAIQTLDAGSANGTAAKFLWSNGASTQTIAVTKSGTYSVTVSAANCTSVSDAIVVTSKLLTVNADTICSAGLATLSAVGGLYNWFDVATGGTPLASAKSIYSPSIVANKTFYVEDPGGVSVSLGKADQTVGAANIWSVGGADFTGQDKINQVTVSKTLTLSSIAVYVNTAGDVTINLKQGATTIHTKTVTGLATGKQTIALGFAIAPGDYIIDAAGSTAMLSFEAAGSATFPYSYPDYISFTNNATWQSTWYGLFYDWKVIAGNVCARTPVTAIIDPKAAKCTTVNTVDTVVSACSSIVFNGKTYTTSGTFTLGVSPKDTILHLTIKKPTFSTITTSACGSYVFNAKTYSTSGTYYAVFKNAVGCDSTVTLKLTINQTTTSTITTTAVGSYVLLGKIYTVSGNYTQTTTNKAGCDSLITLHVTITKPQGTVITQSACTSYLYNGILYTSSGTYTHTFKTNAGLDSVVSLILTINQVSNVTLTQKACNSFVWDGTTYSKSGSYVKTYSSKAGCDSVVTLNLTINIPTISSLTVSAVGSYTLLGTSYTKTGVYYASTLNKAGCDSNITLNLTIVDFNSLLLAINTANTDLSNSIIGSDPGQYLPTSKATLESAIAIASSVSKSKTVSQPEVDKATSDLNTAIDVFLKSKNPSGSKDVLQQQIDIANLLLSSTFNNVGSLPTEYPADAYSALQVAIAHANTIVVKTLATAQEVALEVTALQNAIAAYKASVNPLANIKTLQSTIDLATATFNAANIPAEYSKTAGDVLELAIGDAIVIINNKKSTQTQINEANATLLKAIEIFKASKLTDVVEVVAHSVKVGPIPVVDVETVSSEIAITHISIFNMKGDLEEALSTDSKTVSINLSMLPSGSYVILITMIDGSLITKTITK